MTVPDLRYYRFRRTTLISVGCLGFLIGLGLVKAGLTLDMWWLALSVLCIPFCFKRRVLGLCAVLLIGLILGSARGSVVSHEQDAYRELLGQKIILGGVIIDDPTYGSKGEQVFKIGSVYTKQTDGNKPLPGVIRVTTFAIQDVRRGDSVVMGGKLSKGFGNYQASLSFASLNSTTANKSLVEDLRYNFAAGVYNALPEPQASLGLGFLVGVRSQLPDSLDEQLKLVGLTHIVVASGYNLTVLVRIARRLFEKRSKYQTAVVSAVLIIGFVLVTGFSPSMSRAALVTGLALAAWYYGRRVHPVTLLLFTAAITTLVNPLYLWSDIGWWLSFTAFAGVMLLAPLIQKRLFGEKEPKLIGQILIETLSAQILTLPIILLIFGQMSLLALPANLIIVPLIPLAMLLTFISGVFGVIIPTLAGYFALPAIWLLTFMIQVVNWLAQVDWASVSFKINSPFMVGCYAAILVCGFILWRKTKLSFAKVSIVE